MDEYSSSRGLAALGSGIGSGAMYHEDTWHEHTSRYTTFLMSDIIPVSLLFNSFKKFTLHIHTTFSTIIMDVPGEDAMRDHVTKTIAEK